ITAYFLRFFEKYKSVIQLAWQPQYINILNILHANTNSPSALQPFIETMQGTFLKGLADSEEEKTPESSSFDPNSDVSDLPSPIKNVEEPKRYPPIIVSIPTISTPTKRRRPRRPRAVLAEEVAIDPIDKHPIEAKELTEDKLGRNLAKLHHSRT